MILNIRGTGGAGKSTIARAVMVKYTEQAPVFITGRKRPFGYLCRSDGRPALWVVGHYETPCGGGDTLKTVDDVFACVREHASAGDDCLFEGIISQDDVTRTATLRLDGLPLVVIALRVPIETCLESIKSRRAVKEDERPLNPKNTIAREQRLRGVVSRLRDSNVDVRWCDRENALSTCLDLLGIPA